MKLILTDSKTIRTGNEISLEAFADFGELKIYDDISHQELISNQCFSDILLCNKTVIDKAVMDNMPNLKYIGLFATGYNNIDIEYARKKHITVCNAGSYSTNAVAQQTFSYILQHFSQTHRFDESVKNGDWCNSDTFTMFNFPTDEISGKTIGIIGYGSIGKKVAQIAKAFDMNILVYNRTVYADANVQFVALDDLLKNSDIISLHCPLNEQSRGMFNTETFSKCKDGAFFINTARGAIVEEQALFDALSSGKLSGAGIDVLEHEPMLPDCILKTAPNIIITPHISWAPVATRKRLIDIVYNNIECFLKGNPKNKVS